MKKLFSRKTKPEKIEKQPRVKKETSLTDADYNRKKLFKKGINLMADEKLDDAAIVFEQALRIDPNNVETLLKLGCFSIFSGFVFLEKSFFIQFNLEIFYR